MPEMPEITSARDCYEETKTCLRNALGAGSSWNDFRRVEIRVGTITSVEEFPKARQPAYKLWVDFGTEIGIIKSSAQITVHYTSGELLGKQIVGVVNFPPKQIGPFISEFLVTDFADADGAIILAEPG